MSQINELEIIKKQYTTVDKLTQRISIHEKYSTNKIGFGPWIVSHYDFPEGGRVLELGCGTGSMWKGQDTLIRRCSALVLTDLSEAMLAATREALGEENPLRYAAADIQNLPFPDAFFDAVIANMMLYHVPDLRKGLSEVRRVMKPYGKFYAATYGEHGIVEALCKILAPLGVRDDTNKTFTLQNGGEILRSFFDRVERRDYPDGLRVTEVEDIIDYLFSLPSMESLRSLPRERIRKHLNAALRDGILELPKDYGLFIAYR